MARFRFARDTIANSFTTSDVVNSRAELLAHIQRNVVYLHGLTDSDLHIIPPPSGDSTRLVVATSSLYLVRAPDYCIIGFLDGPLTSEER